ncbi:hypothetical protein Tco_0345841 [Tanacetum coccineum]
MRDTLSSQQRTREESSSIQDMFVAEILRNLDLVNVKAANNTLGVKGAIDTKVEEFVDVEGTQSLRRYSRIHFIDEKMPTGITYACQMMYCLRAIGANGRHEYDVVAQSQPHHPTLLYHPHQSSPTVLISTSLSLKPLI